MAFLVRAATVADAPAIARVHTHSWAETYPGLLPDDLLARMTSPETQARREEMWRAGLSEGSAGPGVVLVAEQGGEVVAFASGGPARDHPGYDAELFTLYALRRVQGQGIGRALLRGVAGGLSASGARRLALWVLDRNPTRAWYARHGAHEAGEKTEGRLHEVRMGWDDLSGLLRE